MRHNTHDKTLYRNYVRKWKFLIQEYELVKQKRHPTFRFVADFYRFHQTHRQTFFKYYHRFRQSGAEHALVPQPRGPKWKSRRVYGYIEQQVLQQRRLGVNRYEICQLLAPKLKHLTPSPSTVYRITRRYGLNRLTPKLREEKRRIVKQKAGELGHLDCHHLSKDLIATDPTRYYLVCVIDACTRLAWAEVVTDLKSLTVMFSALKSFNLLHQRYQLQFAEVLTDNGSEFAAPRTKDTHPFERMLLELGIKHRYTRPYRPQTNGKVERFWRTLNDDLIDGTTFASLAEFRDELEQYLLYYNEVRPHQALEGKTPKQINESCQRITEHIQSSTLVPDILNRGSNRGSRVVIFCSCSGGISCRCFSLAPPRARACLGLTRGRSIRLPPFSPGSPAKACLLLLSSSTFLIEDPGSLFFVVVVAASHVAVFPLPHRERARAPGLTRGRGIPQFPSFVRRGKGEVEALVGRIPDQSAGRASWRPTSKHNRRTT